MINAHVYLESVREEGMDLFAVTEIAHDHSAVTRRVRRHRAVRAATVTAVSVAVVATVAFGAGPIHAAIVPASTPSAEPPSADPSPHALVASAPVQVKPGRRIEDVAAALGAAFHEDRITAYRAILAALPPEANGNPEGWVPAGEYVFDTSRSLQDAADELVIQQVEALMAMDVPREKWEETLIIASLVAKEAPDSPDQGGVARVILNRQAIGMPLDLESPLEYARSNYWALVGATAPDQEGYVTNWRKGLPAGPIGAIDESALNAAVNPAEGDWMYFLRGAYGKITLFTTFEEFYAEFEAGPS